MGIPRRRGYGGRAVEIYIHHKDLKEHKGLVRGGEGGVVREVLNVRGTDRLCWGRGEGKS